MLPMRSLTKKSLRILLPVLLVALTIGLVFGWRRTHDKIRVEFFERGKDKPFAVSMVPVGQLPTSFESATTLDIDDKKWSVVDATPKTRREFERTGHLRVVLAPETRQ